MSERINRRGFLGVSAAAAASLGCSRQSSEAGEKKGNATAPAVPPFELDEVSLADLAAGIRSGKYTAAGLTGKYLERIEQVDRSGPKLNSVIEVNP